MSAGFPYKLYQGGVALEFLTSVAFLFIQESFIYFCIIV